jgi:hypothetical protein
MLVASASGSAGSSGDALDAARAVKRLADSFGADIVRGLAESFGK